MGRYPIPARETRIEMRVVNSRFIATVAPVLSVAEAKAFVAVTRTRAVGIDFELPHVVSVCVWSAAM